MNTHLLRITGRKLAQVALVLTLAGLLFFKCNTPTPETIFGKADADQIRQLINSYQVGWLEDDSSKVMGLISDSATLIPSGTEPIEGKRAIRKFWWPNDSSKTVITSYNIAILEVQGIGDFAYSIEKGKLSWSYKKKDYEMTKDQESYEVTLFRRERPGQWKIVRRIWTDVKK